MKHETLRAVVVLGAVLAFGLFAAGCTVGRAGSAASTNGEATPPPSDPEIGAFRKIAFKACTESTANERASADAADAHCACAVDELVKRVKLEAMVQIGQSGQEDLPMDMEMDLTDAIVACSSLSNPPGQ